MGPLSLVKYFNPFHEKKNQFFKLPSQQLVPYFLGTECLDVFGGTPIECALTNELGREIFTSFYFQEQFFSFFSQCSFLSPGCVFAEIEMSPFFYFISSLIPLLVHTGNGEKVVLMNDILHEHPFSALEMNLLSSRSNKTYVGSFKEDE